MRSASSPRVCITTTSRITPALVRILHGRRADSPACLRPDPLTAGTMSYGAGTANAAIRALIERGDLEEISGRERYRLYEAPRIFEAAYGPVESEEEGSASAG